MQLADLEEWRLLQAAQPWLLAVVEATIKESSSTNDDTKISNYLHGKLSFLSFELEQIARSTSSHHEFEVHMAARFQSEALKLFPWFERLFALSPVLPANEAHTKFPRIWGLGAMEPAERDSLRVHSLCTCSVEDVENWIALLRPLEEFNMAIDKIFRIRQRDSTPTEEPSSSTSLLCTAGLEAKVQSALTSLERGFSKCSTQSTHPMILQAAGHRWHDNPHANSRFSFLLSSCIQSSILQQVECFILQSVCPITH